LPERQAQQEAAWRLVKGRRGGALKHDPDPRGGLSAKWVPFFPRAKCGTRLLGDHSLIEDHSLIKEIERLEEESSRSKGQSHRREKIPVKVCGGGTSCAPAMRCRVGLTPR